MVTTRQDQLEYILGHRTSMIPPHELTVTEWVSIIEAVADRLTLDFLRGFQSIPYLIDQGHNVYLKPTRPPVNIPIIHDLSVLHEAGIRESDTWLPCVRLGGIPDPLVWPKEKESYEIVTHKILLMKRHKKSRSSESGHEHQFEFFVLSLDMDLRKNTEKTIFDSEYWIRVVKAHIKSVYLESVLNTLKGMELYRTSSVLMGQLITAQQMTLEDLSKRRNQAEHADKALRGYASRAGIAV